jgi:hypothetical protein
MSKSRRGCYPPAPAAGRGCFPDQPPLDDDSGCFPASPVVPASLGDLLGIRRPQPSFPDLRSRPKPRRPARPR